MIPHPWIDDAFTVDQVTPGQMDVLWGRGWRHFGNDFFRYSVSMAESGSEWIVPLRLDPAAFLPRKTQRRVLRANADVRWEMRNATLSLEACDLFERHKKRFTSNVPESLAVFLGEDPAAGPCECLEFRCLIGGKLIAVSFLDVGATSVSSLYAAFDPLMSWRSLGTLTMLKEIQWAAGRGMKYYYPGYTTLAPGIYDYKKRLSPLQGYDWSEDKWMPWSVWEHPGMTA